MAISLRPNEPLQVLRLPQVCRVTGLCRSMIYQLEAERRFPCRIKIGVRAVGWIEGEVQQWLVTRIERSRGSLSRRQELRHR
jgi:prophage regulatory protein